MAWASRYTLHFIGVMVVNDLDLPCFTIAPRETDTPSFVDANAVVPPAFQTDEGRPSPSTQGTGV